MLLVSALIAPSPSYGLSLVFFFWSFSGLEGPLSIPRGQILDTHISNENWDILGKEKFQT